MNETVVAIMPGARQADPSLAVRPAEAGRRLALIERARLGGTRVHHGGIPTETLIAGAGAAHVTRPVAAFGVNNGPALVARASITSRKDAMVEQSREGLAARITQTARPEFVLAEGGSAVPGAIPVADRVCEAPNVATNTGGDPVRPDRPTTDPRCLRNNIDMIEQARHPRYLIANGRSPIGLEFALMDRRFGSEVVVIEAAGLPYKTFMRAVPVKPTVSELIRPSLTRLTPIRGGPR